MTYSKALLLGCAGLFTAGSVSAAIIVDDNVETNGDITAEVGTITTAWAGWDGSSSAPYFNILDDAVADGTGVLETVDDVASFGGFAATQSVTYGGTIAVGTYTLELQVLNWGNRDFPDTVEVDFAGLTPDSSSTPVVASSDDEIWTFVYTVEAGDTEIGSDLELSINVSTGDKNYGIDHVRIDFVPVPEPSSLAIIGLGGMAMLCRRRG